MNNVVGSKMYALDFHVHTMASTHDYEDMGASPLDLVEAAIKSNLDAIVVTDHNTINGIEAIRDAANGKDLVVFPGVEINADGGHVIAIFDPSISLDVIETALINAGIGKDEWGSEQAIGKDLSSVFSAIKEKGGIAIAAHADGPKGFLKTNKQGLSKEKTFKDSNLSAIELVDKEKHRDYTQGKLYDRKMACVQGSDAHSLKDIGKKFTLVRMQHLSLEGLRIAFSEPDYRIYFPDEWAISDYPRLERLQINQGFLKDLDIQFNPSLNCLVGGAGSGKSTIIEFLRFTLDQISEVDFIKDDCLGKLTDLAGKNAVFIVTLVMDNGEKFLVKRKFDLNQNPINVTREADGKVLDGVIVSELFPIHAYSQGEAISISRNPLAQLELIDAHINLSQFVRKINSLQSELTNQVPGLLTLAAKAKDHDKVEKDILLIETKLDSLTKELNSLKEAQKNPVMASHHLWETEKTYLKDLFSSVKKTKKKIKEGIDAIEIPLLDVPFPKEITPNNSVLTECKDIANQFTKIREESKRLLVSKLAEIESSIGEKGGNWKELYKKHSEEYNVLKLEDGMKRIEEINSLLADQQRNVHKLRIELISIASADKEFNVRLTKRNDLIKQLYDQRLRVFSLRERKVKEIGKKIGSIVALKLIQQGNIDEYNEIVSSLMKGSLARKQIITKLCEAIHPGELAILLSRRDAKTIDQKSEIGIRWADTIVDYANVKPKFIYQIETAPLEDKINISFEVEKGKYRSIDKLSTGQKATVIVLLAMIEGRQPILFDQPEDALYTPFIFSQVVKTLKNEKDKRQFILATHNSNIAIAGNTDYGIILESTASEARVESSGALDDPRTKELMLLHLEGGPTAFITRQNIFNIQKEK